MKRVSFIFVGFGLSLGLAACNQTAPSADLSASAAVPLAAAEPIAQGRPAPARVAVVPAAGPAPAAVVAQDDMQCQPPIYTPLVDLHNRSQARFDRDHAECRLRAEPQERAARDAMAQQQAGTAIAVAGALSGFIPVRGFGQAVNASRAGGAAQDLGGNIAAGGAERNAAATDDYALVVNNCLSRRGYTLLRG